MAYVLATDVEDMDPDTGAVRLLAKRGDSLPASMKDMRDDYIRDGILVEEHRLQGATSMTFTELEHSLKDIEGLTDEQVDAVKQAFEERRTTFDDGATDDQRRTFARDVSTNLAQVHRDRTQASPAIHRAAGTPKVGEKSGTSSSSKDSK